KPRRETHGAEVVCVMNRPLSFQLSRIYFLWHGCHRPLNPDRRGEAIFLRAAGTVNIPVALPGVV
ncbi:MAG: hypothetical protein ACKPJJ_15370, partial [Planctomycetaceae bacterium]